MGAQADRACVLLVDDDDDILALYRSYLELENCECFAVTSRAGAQGILAEIGGSLDAAVVDIGLGADSGLDLLAQIKSSAPNLAVVMNTSSRSLDNAIVALRSGAFDYLLKPSTQSDLILATRNAISFTRMRRELSAAPLRFICRIDSGQSHRRLRQVDTEGSCATPGILDRILLLSLSCARFVLPVASS